VSGSSFTPDGGCGDAALYLLDLLDGEQKAAFLEHSQSCAVCRDEIGALQAAVDALPTTVPQLAAPEHIKRLVMTTVRGEATNPKSRPAPRGPGRLRGWLSYRQPPSRRPALALAATLLVAAGVGIGTQLSSSTGGATQVVSAEVTIPGARAMLHQSAGHDWLTVAGMPQPSAGHVYEVWVKHPGGPAQPTSSLFVPTTSGVATAAVPSDLGRASEVMVTQEPAGGSQAPTSTAVIVARAT
jgi:Anti-sigma-K factor rskA